jgi:hypothetical protein
MIKSPLVLKFGSFLVLFFILYLNNHIYIENFNDNAAYSWNEIG